MHWLNPFWLWGRLYRAIEDTAAWAEQSFKLGKARRRHW